MDIMATSRGEYKLQIEPPTNCPSCNSELEWSNDQLYCRNQSCPAKSFKQIEHFAKTLKIKGLGPAAIEKLDITTISDIYELDVAYVTLSLGSAKLAIKLLEEIEKSKNEPLNTVLPAFGIPLIGKSATEKLSKVTTSLFEINRVVCKQAGLGPVATNNLINWLEKEFYRYENLPFIFEFEVSRGGQESRGVVCITGKLKSYPSKAAATEILESLGYTVKDSLTKEVTILVNESGTVTAKTQKAEENGVLIITNLKQYIGE